jgi:hypothetical protein
MNDLQKRFFDLVIRYEKLNKERKQVWEEIEMVTNELGIGSYHQDTDLTVYKITKPTGAYVEFRQIGYDRTAKADESRGTLSKKEAEENGFLVFKKA